MSCAIAIVIMLYSANDFENVIIQQLRKQAISARIHSTSFAFFQL